MTDLTLNKHLLLDDVSAWLDSAGGLLRIRLTNRASFDPGVEGVAIAVLHHLVLRKTTIEVNCAFRPLDAESKPHGVLCSLFGLHLVSSAKVIHSEMDGRDLRVAVLSSLWSMVKASGGEFGDGKRRSIVFRDPDYSVPECLQESGSSRFPYPNKFKSLLATLSKKLSEESEISTAYAEDGIATFLYEAALNAHEHGRWAAGGNEVGTAIRGISIEKLTFSSPQELVERPRLSTLLKEFIARGWDDGSRRRQLLAITVSDVGAGIQNTLPREDDESPWMALHRAFKSGETRKPVVPNKGLGEGLPNIADAAKVLKAFLLVSSADLIGYQDFTMSDGPIALTRLPDIDKGAGTSLTIVWPIVSGRGSQASLF